MIERTVEVDLSGRAYSILIGRGLLRSVEACAGFDGATGSSVAIVTNDVVAPLHAEGLAATLETRMRRVVRIVLPDGEAQKTLATFATIQGRLLEAGLDRHSIVYALGGGVVGDLAGFAAACFHRGIAFVQVPTTLLAQVDSSVGGKTGVNHETGKNLVGAFHQPRRVIADLDTLATLPEREYRSGIAEIVKIAAVADAGFFGWLERAAGALRDREPSALLHAVARSCELKAAIVAGDERESGARAVLNFGHTFAHAIESGLGFGAWLHGEAVAAGMVMAAALSGANGMLSSEEAGRLEALLREVGLPVRGPALGADAYLRLMASDKKAVAGQLRFILLERLGAATLAPVPDGLVRDAVVAMSASA